MMPALVRWMKHRWMVYTHPELLRAYEVTFNSLHGQMVLQHLLDSVYCDVSSTTSPEDALVHNARRSVVQEILENLDAAEHPQKYNVTVQTEEKAHA